MYFNYGLIGVIMGQLAASKMYLPQKYFIDFLKQTTIF